MYLYWGDQVLYDSTVGLILAEMDDPIDLGFVCSPNVWHKLHTY
jgi:hypothetical protein